MRLVNQTESIFIETVIAGCPVTCTVVPCGADLSITILGGNAPHVGSVVMAVSRPSLTGEGLSATTSVLNRTGHKDDAIAVAVAENLAARLNCAVSCTCGVHIDNITPDQLSELAQAGTILVELIMKHLFS